MPELSPTQRVVDVIKKIDKRDYQLPSIQRSFVWDQDRILRLLDSIMCGYPIGAVMVWRPSGQIRCRPFLRDYISGERLVSQLPAPAEELAHMVLDGQQRLQSLYLAFHGTFDRERAFLRIDSKADETEDDLHYWFEFLDDDQARSDQRFVHLSELATLGIRNIVKFVAARLPDADAATREQACEIVSQFVDAFSMREALLFQEIDANLDYNDVLEVFERVNSGGIALSKSDLLFSTVTLKIPDMEERFIRIVDDLNENGRFDFNNDFVIKAAFVVFGKGAKYDFKKLTDTVFLDTLKRDFDKLEKVITSLRVWLDGKALIKGSRFLRSKLALIPLIDYLMMTGKLYGPNDGAESNAMRQYLYMSMFTRLFSRAPDSVLDQIHDILTTSHANHKGVFPIKELGDLMARRERKDCYQFREDYLWDLDIVLNIVDGGIKEIPSKRGWSLERDHIFPQNQLQIANIVKDVHDLGNFRFLGKSRNIQKSDAMPDGNTEFFGMADPVVKAAYDQACIAFTQDNFSDFVQKRRNRLLQQVTSFLGL